MRYWRLVIVSGMILSLASTASIVNAQAGAPRVDTVDRADRELLVRLAPEPAGPAPEAVVEAVRDHRPLAGLIAAGEPVDSRLMIRDRPRAGQRDALSADPDRPRARLLRWVVLTYSEGTDLAAVEEALAADPRVEVVERNLRASLSAVTPNDPYFPLQWGSFTLELPEAWERTKGHGFVGLIDTGIDVDHPDLEMTFGTEFKGGNFRPHLSHDFAWPSTCATNPGCVDENEPGDPSNFIYHGHGTHVSGIVGATANNGKGVAGNCWHCSILMARTRFPASEVADALRWLADHGAQAVSMSFGWPTVQSAIADAIDDVNERDLILVAAVGNDLEDIEFPALDPDVIAAGGTEEPLVPGTVDFWERDVCPSAQGPLPDCFGGTVTYPGTVECGSNYTVTMGSPMVELVAPAADVFSTFYLNGCWNEGLGCHDGGHPAVGYDYCTGTSMSSPNVASLATLVRSVNPLLSQADVRDILKTTASGGGVWDDQLGYGVPDTAAAVDTILGTVAGAVLPNRLTPLFNFYSGQAETHLSTTVPQRATAAIFDSEVSFVSHNQGDPVPGYPGFPGEPPCNVGPCLYKPKAWVSLFTTDQEPFPGAPAMVPLYRMSYDEPFGGNPLNRSFAYTTERFGVKVFHDVGYQLDGIEGYIYKRCTPEPSCIPTGAVRLFRMYHVDRDDYVVIPESKVAQFQADGYSFPPSLNDWIGYVYENVDVDGDDVIDGFETLIGTDPFLADSDGDGLDDGEEILEYPYSDPLESPGVPTAVDDFLNVPCGAASFDIPYSVLVANDVDPDQDTLTPCLASSTSHGTLNQHLSLFRYFPSPAYWVYGADSFTYRATDGPFCPGNSNEAMVTLTADCFGPGKETFHDSFESGDLSAWDGIWIPNGGALEVTPAASMSGALGLEVILDASTTIAMLVHDTAAVENHYNAAFLLDPSSLQMADGNSHAVFAGLEGWNGPYTVQLRMRRYNGDYQIGLDTWDDSQTWAATPSWVTLADAPNAVRIEWWAADEPGDDDGGIRLWLDGVQVGELLGLDNDEKVIGRVRFGALGVDPGTEGSFYLDAFRTWRGDRSRSVILSEDFDDGILPWSTWIPNEGSIDVTAAAKITGRYGMEVEMVPGSTHVFAYDNSPQAESRFETFLRFDPNSLPSASQPGTFHIVFVAADQSRAGWTAVIRLRRSGNGERLEMQVFTYLNDGTRAETPWVTIADEAHRLRLQWQAASGAANDGSLRFWIDGGLAGELTDLANSQKRVHQVWLGDSGGPDEGTVGSFYYDDFRAWR